MGGNLNLRLPLHGDTFAEVNIEHLFEVFVVRSPTLVGFANLQEFVVDS